MVRDDEIEEEPFIDRGLDQLKKDIEKLFSDEDYKENKIRAILTKKHEMRHTYLSLVVNDLSRIGEIMEKTNCTRRTIYLHLYKLLSLGLIEKIPILEIVKKNGRGLNDMEKIIFEKFEKWSSGMNDGMKRRYTSVTCYWFLTDLGKKPNIVNWAIRQEKEMKGYLLDN